MTSPIPAWQGQPPSSDDFLNGKSVKSFSFDAPPPLRLGGPITELPPVIQKRDFDSGEPQFWNDGRPKWVMPVYCQTDARDDQEDDGVRAHYLEYRKANAVKAAMKLAGVQRLEVGGTLWLTYVPPKPPAGQAKSYTAEYTPPPPGFAQAQAQDDAWAGLGPTTTALPAPQQQAWAPQPAPTAANPALVAFLATKGIDARAMGAEQAQMIANTFPDAPR